MHICLLEANSLPSILPNTQPLLLRCTALHVQVLTGGLGTYQWAAPEVLAHQRYSEKADVYRYGHGSCHLEPPV